MFLYFPLAALLGVLAISLPEASAQDWGFADAGTDGVTFVPGAVRFNEEAVLTGPILLITYTGNIQPTIEGDPMFKDFQPSISKVPEGWALYIAKNLDYESYSSPNFFPQIRADGVVNDVTVSLLNVDDTAPSVSGPTCFVEEGLTGDVGCKYIVQDLDGCAANTKLTATDQAEDSTLFTFELVGSTVNYPGCLNPPSSTTAEFTMIVNTELDFETLSSYILVVTSKDDAGNEGDPLQTTVKVLDIPDEPPLWVSVVASFTVIEMTLSTQQLSARDGDFNINAAICYSLEVLGDDLQEEEKNYFAIDDTGLVTVQPIDRDFYQTNTYNLNVSAFECADVSWVAPPLNIFVQVQDTNNKSPVMCVDPADCTKPYPAVEADEGNVQFPVTIEITDPDLGTAGTFTVELTQDASGTQWSDAFMVIPNQAYQKGTFSISVKDQRKLDYEDVNWRHILMQLVVTEVAEPLTHTSSTPIEVTLLNINDNPPILDEMSLEVELREDVIMDSLVTILVASDADGPEDKLTFAIQGTSFIVDPDIGKVTTAKDGALDYERQQEVVVQVTVKDSMRGDLHTTYGALTIHVIDVNDTPPQLTLGTAVYYLDEASAPGTLITSEGDILASDVDTESVLEFSIDWAKSTARKNSREVDRSLFEGSCTFVTSDPVDGAWAGELQVVNGISWNDVDTLLLYVLVTDTNQTINRNTDGAMITINLNDINDHGPVIDQDSCATSRSVNEGSNVGQIIGSPIKATDLDGPGNNIITFTLEPDDGKVKIDEYGQLLVDGDIDAEALAADQLLTYTVIATNEGFPTNDECEVKIFVNDVNDNTPVIQASESQVNIKEDVPPDTLITHLTAYDLDVSEPFHTLEFTLDSSSMSAIRNYFYLDPQEVGPGNYTISLMAKQDPAYLFDFDEGDKTYTVTVIARDNINDQTNSRSSSATVVVNLEDVNDNAPVFQNESPTECIFQMPETKLQGDTLTAPDYFIRAIDKDSGVNAWVNYTLESAECQLGSNKGCTEDGLTLFSLGGNSANSRPDVQVYVAAGKNLLDLYGNYLLTILATDNGEDPKSSTGKYLACIYNANTYKPTFDFPKPGGTDLSIYYDDITDSLLQLADSTALPLIHATDPDFQENGTVTYTIVDTQSVFKLDPAAGNSAVIGLVADAPESNLYPLTIEACDSGVEQKCTRAALNLRVTTNKQVEPVFDVHEATFEFTENSTGLNEKYTFVATDPNNDVLPPESQEKIFYYIIGGDPPEYTNFFQLDQESGELTLMDMLDATVCSSYDLTVQASNKNLQQLPNNPSGDSLQLLHVTVKDINDKWPVFKSKIYTAVVSVNNEQFTKLHADDPDADDAAGLLYTIVPGSVDASHVEGTTVNASTVVEVSADGTVTFHHEIDDSIKGYIEFDAMATDKASHTDTCHVKVFILSQQIRVKFSFDNTRPEIDANLEKITEILAQYLGYTCIHGPIEGDATTTNVTFYFMDGEEDPVPVPSETINLKLQERQMVDDIRLALFELSIKWLTLGENSNAATDNYAVKEAVLIAVGSVLGVLLVVMIGLYFFKTRRLKQLIKKLTNASTTELTPSDKDTFALPNTNQRAAYASNPVFDTDITHQHLDNVSMSSNDSSLIGIEDNPDFQAFYNDVILKGETEQGDVMY